MIQPTQDPNLWGGIGAILAAAGTGAGGWLMGRRKNKAAEGAEIAQHSAVAAEANADGEIYRRLLDRVVSLEKDVQRFNQELDAERRLRRHLENHVGLLERMMIAAGMTPPALNPFGTYTPAPPTGPT